MFTQARGEGAPIVFVHGWGAAGGATWRYQLDGLAATYQVIVPDLPGFGRSPPLPHSDADAFAGALDRLIAASGFESVLLVGWSMGGLVSLAYCAQLACRRLAGVVIVDVAPRTLPDADWVVGEQLHAGFAGGVDAWVSRWPGDRDEVLREVMELAFADPPAHRPEIEQLIASARMADETAAIQAFTEIARRDFRPTLPQVTVPSLLIFGGRSTSTTPWVRRYMAEQLPGSTVAVVEGSGHAVMLEEPDRFNSIVGDFASAILPS